jgi:hypothetical protein
LQSASWPPAPNFSLVPTDIHFSDMTAAVRLITAARLRVRLVAGRQSSRPQGETGASQGTRPVCATVTPTRPSFRRAIGRASYLMAASYRSAT